MQCWVLANHALAGQAGSSAGSSRSRKKKGGDLDWNPPGTIVKPFAEVLAKLEKGKHRNAGTDPVRLACHPARRCPQPAIPRVRHGQAAAALEDAGAGSAEIRERIALE